MNEWIICDFTPFSTVLQSYQEDGQMIKFQIFISIKSFYRLRSAENAIFLHTHVKISNFHKYKNLFTGSGQPRMLFSCTYMLNATNYWHFNIYEQEKFYAQMSFFFFFFCFK